MAQVRTGGEVRPGEFLFVLRAAEYVEAGMSPITDKELNQPYVLGLVEVRYETNGTIIIHGHPYVGGLYGAQLAEVIGRKVYERVMDSALPTLKSYVLAGHTTRITLTVRELRHILREIGVMEPVS